VGEAQFFLLLDLFLGRAELVAEETVLHFNLLGLSLLLPLPEVQTLGVGVEVALALDLPVQLI
jgi:hypothetical protein